MREDIELDEESEQTWRKERVVGKHALTEIGLLILG
jgi:hypothetical protein